MAGRGGALATNTTCRGFTLAGGARADDPIAVDDDLVVYLNGNAIFRDNDWHANTHPPIRFRARAGDRLRVVTINRQPRCRSLRPVVLHCNSGGQPRRLTTGVVEICDDTGQHGIFFSRTWTI